MKSSEIIIQRKLSERQREEVAQILYDAFSAKLLHVWYHNKGKRETLALLKEGLGYEHGLYAVLKGQVLGFVGMDYGRGKRFLKIPFEKLTETYGFGGGLFRHVMYMFESTFVDSRANSHQTRIFPIAVSPQARGQGLGSILLKAVDEHAQQEDKRSVVLEVIDSNLRARKLYEKEGYVTTGYCYTAFFTKKAGFSGIHYMKKKLPMGLRSGIR
ncbi:hypothetical protein AU468_06270 [Alkalispirochaeta sphaeroplastigenens]|uniref:N-acetyltransferase domain-containing protein n=1 Tax=Alkalispirochaeta sphaeroplastigenens TaxID=1187066 RepID=A0A2S4JSF7_9SPIO|nr:GNAT family N-acetyltransferase [Alkalispirochaeta sphaeroplastigenens]POR02474.1 hypothetical protein AU468_06270 [Alkalispirochaeta sphaeroplastigenens]